MLQKLKRWLSSFGPFTEDEQFASTIDDILNGRSGSSDLRYLRSLFEEDLDGRKDTA